MATQTYQDRAYAAALAVPQEKLAAFVAYVADLLCPGGDVDEPINSGADAIDAITHRLDLLGIGPEKLPEETAALAAPTSPEANIGKLVTWGGKHPKRGPIRGYVPAGTSLREEVQRRKLPRAVAQAIEEDASRNDRYVVAVRPPSSLTVKWYAPRRSEIDKALAAQSEEG